ncbi:MAG: TlyA family RNA methyltransferase [Desulforegulaceae bacterium]|nr:TlyA family RNA methyltransferase [Desulforegulaceae bacterium]
MTNKIRLDQILVEMRLAENIKEAKALIMAGNVVAEGFDNLKSGSLIPENTIIRLKKQNFPFVSRGALKLKEAVEKTGFEVSNLICMDIGASTGGFTDYLLQKNASKVYAVDVAYGQLAWKLRQDKRVIVIERTNIRNLEFDTIGEKVDLVVCDTSFISLKTVIPSAIKFMKKNSEVFALIKPQFEAEKNEVEKGGVVRDKSIHQRIIEELTSFFKKQGLVKKNLVSSPIKGPKGNQEYIIQLTLRQ